MSALSSLYYAVDKRRALLAWLEDTGNLPALLRTIGGLARRSTIAKGVSPQEKKGDYQRVFWEIVILHGILWLIYLYFDFTR